MCPVRCVKVTHRFLWPRSMASRWCVVVRALFSTRTLACPHSELVKIYTDYYHRPGHWKAYLEDHQQSVESRKKKFSGLPQELWFPRYARVWSAIERVLPPAGGQPRSSLDIGGGSSLWHS